MGHGDAAHHTGDATSEAGGKKGDTVVEIGGAVGRAIANVVFEAKNRKLSKNEAWAELNACMTERDSVYGVLVVAGDDKVPVRPRGLHRVPGQQDHRHARPGGARPGRRAARVPLRPGSRAGGEARTKSGPRRSRGWRGGRGRDGRPEAREPHRASRSRTSPRARRPRGLSSTRWSATSSGVSLASRAWSRPRPKTPSWARARAAAGRSASSCARDRRRASSRAPTCPRRRPCSRPARG